MRQYEHQDCTEDAKEGKDYEVVAFSRSGGWVNCGELVFGFGNPKTRNVVWVPYGSRIKVDGVDFKVIRGSPFEGRRDSKVQSVKCLEDSNFLLHSLYDFRGKRAIVSKLE